MLVLWLPPGSTVQRGTTVDVERPMATRDRLAAPGGHTCHAGGLGLCGWSALALTRALVHTSIAAASPCRGHHEPPHASVTTP